jgi:predicted PurR-regulated permease PerM
MKDARRAPTPCTIAAWILTAAALVLVLVLGLLPALLAGLLVYELVHVLSPALSNRLSHRRAKLAAVALLSICVVGLITAAVITVIAFFQSDAGSLPALLTKMADIIEKSRERMPAWLLQYMPATRDDINDWLGQWLRSHAAEVQAMGQEAGRAFLQFVIGMVLGAMIALHETTPMDRRPLAAAMTERAARVGVAFRRVVFAQMQISFLNTIFTGIYLAVVLPFFGVDLPFTKTLILVSFIAGLLPVVGNLISNTVIVVVSLSHSLQAAIGSLVFLIVIHKLEYFLNARIMGTRIQARAWEVLTATLVMEAAFGISGVVAAAIYYAYLKDELADQGLI